jgi:hypothetical protein
MNTEKAINQEMAKKAAEHSSDERLRGCMSGIVIPKLLGRRC